MTPPESSRGSGASTSPAKSSAAKSPYAPSPSKTKKSPEKASSQAKKGKAGRASREADFTASGAESLAEGERITVHDGHMTIEAGTPREHPDDAQTTETSEPQEVANEPESVEVTEAQAPPEVSAAEPVTYSAEPVQTEPIAVVERPAITKPPYVPRTVRPVAVAESPQHDVATSDVETPAERVPETTPAPFPRRPTAGERFAPSRSRVREWMTDRRAIVISLVPVAAIVGLVAGAAVYTAVSAPPPAVVASSLSPSQTAAQTWLVGNADRSERILVDSALAPGLVAAGWAPGDVLSAGDAATLPWRDVSYIASDAATGDPTTAAALLNSLPVASFGDLEVRRVVPEGVVVAAASEQAAAATRREFGAEISRNPAVEMATPDRVAFAGGQVDERISAVLGALAAVGVVTVTDLPVIAGEEARPIRQIALNRVGDVSLVSGDEPSEQAQAIFDALSGDYALDALTVDGTDLVLRFALHSETSPE